LPQQQQQQQQRASQVEFSAENDVTYVGAEDGRDMQASARSTASRISNESSKNARKRFSQQVSSDPLTGWYRPPTVRPMSVGGDETQLVLTQACVSRPSGDIGRRRASEFALHTQNRDSSLGAAALTQITEKPQLPAGGSHGLRRGSELHANTAGLTGFVTRDEEDRRRLRALGQEPPPRTSAVSFGGGRDDPSSVVESRDSEERPVPVVPSVLTHDTTGAAPQQRTVSNSGVRDDDPSQSSKLQASDASLPDRSVGLRDSRVNGPPEEKRRAPRPSLFAGGLKSPWKKSVQLHLDVRDASKKSKLQRSKSLNLTRDVFAAHQEGLGDIAEREVTSTERRITELVQPLLAFFPREAVSMFDSHVVLLNVVRILCAFISATLVPYTVAFGYETEQVTKVAIFIEYFVSGVYFMTTLLLLQVAFIDQRYKEIVTVQARVWAHRILSKTWWMDIISCLPWKLVMPPLPAMLIQLLRSHRFLFLPDTFVDSEYSVWIQMLRLVINLLTCCNVCGCLWYIVNQYTDNVSWRAAHYDNPEMGTKTAHWAWAFNDALFMAMGRVLYVMPRSNAELVFQHIMGPVGTVLVACIVGEITWLYHRLHQRTMKHLEEITWVREAVKALDIPAELCARILVYFRYTQIHHDWSIYATLFKGLSPVLDLELKLYLYGDLLEHSAFFRNCGSQVIKSIVIKLVLCIFAAGDFVIRKNETAAECFFIVRGICEVMIDVDTDPVATFRRGQHFGEMALYRSMDQNAKRTAWVRSTTYAHLARLDRSAFEDVLFEYPAAAGPLYAQLGEFISERYAEQAPEISANAADMKEHVAQQIRRESATSHFSHTPQTLRSGSQAHSGSISMHASLQGGNDDDDERKRGDEKRADESTHAPARQIDVAAGPATAVEEAMLEAFAQKLDVRMDAKFELLRREIAQEMRGWQDVGEVLRAK